MKLYLCEKPSQASDIARHVGAHRRRDGFFEGERQGEAVIVTFAVGHLLELAYPDAYRSELKQWNLDTLPFVPKSNEWKTEPKPATLKQFKVVQGLLKRANSLVIATDADREGELIAYELIHSCAYQGDIKRLWLGALDDASIKKALANVQSAAKTKGMANAGLARSRADWVVGLNLTRALTKAFGAGGQGDVLNCGRVQTPVMALVVKRERAIERFIATPYYELAASFQLAGSIIPMKWLLPIALKQQRGEFAGALDAQGRIVSRAVVVYYAALIQGKTGRVGRVTQSSQKTPAPLPYSLSSLQLEASRRFGMKPSQVLDVCQALYEKHKATSYPRTDCEYLPESMLGEVPSVLEALASAVGGETLFAGFDALLAGAVKQLSTVPTQRLRAFNTAKISAHHAIIPTLKQGVNVAAMNVNEQKIYDLIRRRYLAQLLGDYVFDQTDVLVVCEGESFSAKGVIPTTLGWKQCYPPALNVAKPSKPKTGHDGSVGESELEVDNEGDLESVVLPAVREGMQAHCSRATVKDCLTQAPKRYTEGTLLGAMESIDKEIDDPKLKAIMKNKEKAGIGTDATRASIIQGLFDNRFLGHHVKFKKHIIPSSKANQFVDILEKVAPSVIDPVLTALWEEQLTAIEKADISNEQFELAIEQWVGGCVAAIKLHAHDTSLKVQSMAKPASLNGSKAPSNKFTKPVNQEPFAASKVVLKPANTPSKPMAAASPCPECNGALVLTPSSKYPGKYLLVCSKKPCRFYTWPKN